MAFFPSPCCTNSKIPAVALLFRLAFIVSLFESWWPLLKGTVVLFLEQSGATIDMEVVLKCVEKMKKQLSFPALLLLETVAAAVLLLRPQQINQ
eukprot:CAMPEP_0194036564 /NCGR_PEP_ID=MMETSP0009_2-20130614/8920_1 /TAXON_ID=210454 /ORGANISM="Grammatophora oceanica, Strain CCMP 410" /LENGTH=93 /DNA_ID=CAMNT_0038678373 /DNA_START=1130 /DNA_END=1411 /DNA_ORIENTATION=+